tara:strand:+ start:173 stop:310 length:138 start_codon:yes stop_codon:yes gene_type:complete
MLKSERSCGVQIPTIGQFKKSWKMLDLYSVSFVALTVNKGEKKDE